MNEGKTSVKAKQQLTLTYTFKKGELVVIKTCNWHFSHILLTVKMTYLNKGVQANPA